MRTMTSSIRSFPRASLPACYLLHQTSRSIGCAVLASIAKLFPGNLLSSLPTTPSGEPMLYGSSPYGLDFLPRQCFVVGEIRIAGSGKGPSMKYEARQKLLKA